MQSTPVLKQYHHDVIFYVLFKGRVQIKHIMIYFSIIAMPKKSRFTTFATQNFVQNTEKHTWIPSMLESGLQGK